MSGQDDLWSCQWIVHKFVKHSEVLCMLGLIHEVEDKGILELALNTSVLPDALEEYEHGYFCIHLLFHQFNNLCEEFACSEAALLLDSDYIELDFTS